MINLLLALFLSFAQAQSTTQRTGTVVSDLNSRITLLGASQTFTGTCEEVRKYSDITVTMTGTPSAAPGTLIFEFAYQCADFDTALAISVPYTLAGPNSFVPLPLRNVFPYFRLKYVNGSTPQTAFRLITTYHWQTSGFITRVVNQTIDENEPVQNVRSIPTGKSPDGPYTNLPSTGIVSSQSTTTLLGSSGVFQGPIILCEGYLAVSMRIISNVNSADMGVEFLWFADSSGSIPLGKTPFTYGNAPDMTPLNVPVGAAKYFRVRYTNGTLAQASFALSTALIISAPPPDVLPISSTITGNNAAQISRAVIDGLKESGGYSTVGLSNTSSLKVAITDRPSEVRSRVSVVANIDHVSLSATPTVIYTPTVGKSFYLLNIIISCLNNTNSVGRFNLNDNGTVKAPFSIASKPVGGIEGQYVAIASFTEPIKFTTNIRATEVSGDVICSLTVGGYDE